MDNSLNISALGESKNPVEKLMGLYDLEKKVLADERLQRAIGTRGQMLTAIRSEIESTAGELIGSIRIDEDLKSRLFRAYEQDYNKHGFWRTPSYFEASAEIESGSAIWLFVPAGVDVERVCAALLPQCPLVDARSIHNLRDLAGKHSERTPLVVREFESLHASYQRHLCDMFAPFVAVSQYIYCGDQDLNAHGFPARWESAQLDAGVADRIRPVKMLGEGGSCESFVSFATESRNWIDKKLPFDAILDAFLKP